MAKVKSAYERWENIQVSERIFLPVLVIGVFLSWLMSVVPGPLGGIVSAVLLISAVVLLWRHPVRRLRVDLWAVLIAMLTYFAVALFISPRIINYYARAGSSDIGFYIDQGREIAKFMASDPGTALVRFATSAALSTAAFKWVVGLFSLLSGGSALGVSVVSAWFGVLGGFYFIRAFRLPFPDKSWRWYVPLVLFFPSIVFWLTLPLKDVITFWSLGLLTYGLARFVSGDSWGGLARVVAAEAACFAIRPYFAAFFGVPLLALGLGYVFQSAKKKARGPMVAASVLVLANVLVLQILVSNSFFVGLDSPQALSDYQSIAGGTVGGSTMRSEPPLDIGPSASQTPPPQLSYAAERVWYVFTVLFRPLPWEAHNLFAVLASLENLILLLLVGGVLLNLRPIFGLTLREPLLIFAAGFAALFVAAFSLQVVNLGTMVRLKINALPFVFPFVSLALEQLWNAFLGWRRRPMNKPVKVLHVVTIDMSIRFMLLPMLLHLRSKGYDVHTACRAGQWSHEVEHMGIPVTNVSFTRVISPLQDLVAFWQLYRLCLREKFDIVQTHTPKANLYGRLAAWLANTPVIIGTEHGFLFENYTGIKRATYAFISRLGARFSDVTIVINHDDYDMANRDKLVPPKRLVEMPTGLGVDVEKFRPDVDGTAIRSHLRVSPSDILVGFVGRLNPEKGCMELIEAAAVVVREFLNVQFVFVGPSEGNYQDTLERAVKRLGLMDKVMFLGLRPDIPQVMAGMDILVLPSHREGLGLVLLEASAMGKPVIATAIRGCRAAVEDGETGFLVRPHDVPQLANALEKVIVDEELRRQMGMAGRRRVEMLFDARKAFAHIDDIYARLLTHQYDGLGDIESRKQITGGYRVVNENLAAVSKPLRVCRIVTVPITFLTLLREQIRCIADSGIELTLVASPGPEFDEIANEMPFVRCKKIVMVRQPSPLRDLMSFWEITRFLRGEQFDVVHSSTPKAGLLVALAGVVSGCRNRIHTYTGQTWVELHGLIRAVVREADRVIGLLDTQLYADSKSQRDFLIAEGLVPARKIRVLAEGSISGVDFRRFDRALISKYRGTIRRRLGIDESTLVVVFVGRIHRDKGIVELIGAFQRLSGRFENLALLLVGPLETARDPLLEETLRHVREDRRMFLTGFTPHPEQYLAAADIFCLPSYREGFGSVVIEAGAMLLPTVATRVTGVVDSVLEGQTGLLVPPKNTMALADALEKIILHPELRQGMGQAAYRYARHHYDAKEVNQAIVDEYFRIAGLR